VVASPIADIFNACFTEVVDSIEGLSQARTEPAAGPLTREFFNDIHGLHNHVSLVFQLMHWLLIITMGVELPPAIDACHDRFWICFTALCIESYGWLYTKAIE